MKQFVNYVGAWWKATRPQKSHGTYRLRRERWDKMLRDEGWVLCDHLCHSTKGRHKEPLKFSHWETPPDCKFGHKVDIYDQCETCLLIPFEGEFKHMKIKLNAGGKR